jgi:hypothetical protein
MLGRLVREQCIDGGLPPCLSPQNRCIQISAGLRMADAEHAALLIYQVDVSIHLLIVCLFQVTTSLTVFGDECWHICAICRILKHVGCRS